MFSWIIEQKATILDVKNWVFEVENTFGEIPVIWQSIAHDWACMTITKATLEKYSFFAMEESLKVTNFHTKKIWDFFNVERSLKVWDRIDWHFVTWHIDTIGKIDKIIINDDKSKIIYTKFDEKYINFIIKKWSITINWVSLTIVDAWNDYLSVSLIPLTQEITNLGYLRVWDVVNLEFDMMWKYISKMMWK